jgi:hypothetical protein
MIMSNIMDVTLFLLALVPKDHPDCVPWTSPERRGASHRGRRASHHLDVPQHAAHEPLLVVLAEAVMSQIARQIFSTSAA